MDAALTGKNLEHNNGQNHNVEEVGRMLLAVGTLLLGAGANTDRIRITINRFSHRFGFNSEVLITHHAIMLTMNKDDRQVYSHLKRSENYVINFKMLSGISRLSWQVAKGKYGIDEIEAELKRLREIPPYSRKVVVFCVALAGASFCRLFGGNASSMLLSFVATASGLVTLQEMRLRKFNNYLSIFTASFVASLIAALVLLFYPEVVREHSLTASILFLVPGIALFNGFSDLIEGNLLNGILRGVNSLMVAFCMALGWLLAVFICGVWT